MDNKIEFTDYDRISDILMWLSDKLTLNFVTVLAKTSNGRRRFFSYETSYGQDKFSDRPNRSIKRNMDFYFVIDNREVFANGLVLRPQDVQTLLMFIELNVTPWFFGPKNKQAFRIINNTLTLSTFSPMTWAQSDNRYITFEPYIFEFEDGTSTQSIKMTFHSGDVAILTIDKFMGFVNLLHTDMYSVAAANAVYAKTEPYGVNVYDTRGLGGGKNKDNKDNNWNMNYNGSSYNSFLENSKSKKEE